MVLVTWPEFYRCSLDTSLYNKQVYVSAYLHLWCYSLLFVDKGVLNVVNWLIEFNGLCYLYSWLIRKRVDFWANLISWRTFDIWFTLNSILWIFIDYLSFKYELLILILKNWCNRTFLCMWFIFIGSYILVNLILVYINVESFQLLNLRKKHTMYLLVQPNVFKTNLWICEQ